MKNRIGKIELTKDLVESIEGLFRDINPIGIDRDEYVITYTCLSSRFDEVDEGEEIPYYEIEVFRHLSISELFKHDAILYKKKS